MRKIRSCRRRKKKEWVATIVGSFRVFMKLYDPGNLRLDTSYGDCLDTNPTSTPADTKLVQDEHPGHTNEDPAHCVKKQDTSEHGTDDVWTGGLLLEASEYDELLEELAPEDMVFPENIQCYDNVSLRSVLEDTFL